MDVFVARQPIFNRDKEVTAYELLFRSGIDNFYNPDTNGDAATLKVISNSFLVIGLETLTAGKRAFINFTKSHLLARSAFSLPKDMISIEILENIEPEEEVISACRELKDSGYCIALDDFVFDEKYIPFLEIADIIKVDFMNPDKQIRAEIINACPNKGTVFLAEKVETQDDFFEGIELGYKYFQGYFFSKPVIIQGRDIPSNKVSHMRILSEINRKEIEVQRVENIIKHDIGLSYKLLRFINSAYFNLSVEVSSIHHALVLLGTREIKKWVSLMAISGLADDKPQELVSLSLVRAKFSESVAIRLGQSSRAPDFFLTGLFSVIDALLDKPIKEVLEELPISADIKNALTGKINMFLVVLKLAIAYEQADWETTLKITEKLRIDETTLPELYFDALKWANLNF